MSKALEVFSFNGLELRTIKKGDASWFIASDICDALEIKNHRDALSKLDADEKGVALTDTLGGKQKVATVNESGLYALVMQSRKASAKVFRKWVTSEVLPSIRKTGSFQCAHDIARQVAKEVFKLQCAEIKFIRDVQCLQTKGYHYSNEACMVGRVITGTWGGLDRDNMDDSQLRYVAKIEGRNSTYIAQGLDIKLREELLSQFRAELVQAAMNHIPAA